MKGLRGCGVLITGASSGIGQATAVRFGQEGANVAINYPEDAGKARETEQEVGAAVARCHDALRRLDIRTALVKADVSDEQHVARMVRETIDSLGGLDVLINNAGVQVDAPTDEMRVEDFDRVVAVNLRGAFLCAREAIRYWLAEGRRGVIVNVQRARGHSEAPLHRVQREQGWPREPHAHLGAGVRRSRHSRERRRPGRDDHADELRVG